MQMSLVVQVFGHKQQIRQTDHPWSRSTSVLLSLLLKGYLILPYNSYVSSEVGASRGHSLQRLVLEGTGKPAHPNANESLLKTLD